MNPAYYNTAMNIVGRSTGASGMNANYYNNWQSQTPRYNVVKQKPSRYHVHTVKEYIPVISRPTTEYRERVVVQPVTSQDRKNVRVVDKRRVNVVVPPQVVKHFTTHAAAPRPVVIQAPAPRPPQVIYQQAPQIRYVQQRPYAYHGYGGSSSYNIGTQGGLGGAGGSYANILGIGG